MVGSQRFYTRHRRPGASAPGSTADGEGPRRSEAMPTPHEYVRTYLTLDFFLENDGQAPTWQRGQIRNYLQSGKGEQSIRAQAAQKDLLGALGRKLGGGGVADEFDFEDYSFYRTSIERV